MTFSIKHLGVLLIVVVALCAQRAEAGFLVVEIEGDLPADSQSADSSSSMGSEVAEDVPRHSIWEILALEKVACLPGLPTTGGMGSGATSSSSPAPPAILPLAISLTPSLSTRFVTHDRAFSPQMTVSEIFRPPCA